MSSAPIEEQLDAISEQNRRLALEKDELTEQNGELVSRNDELTSRNGELDTKLQRSFPPPVHRRHRHRYLGLPPAYVYSSLCIPQRR